MWRKCRLEQITMDTELTINLVGIYYKSFNLVNFANQKALAKIKGSIYLWIHIVQTKCIASN